MRTQVRECYEDFAQVLLDDVDFCEAAKDLVSLVQEALDDGEVESAEVLAVSKQLFYTVYVLFQQVAGDVESAKSDATEFALWLYDEFVLPIDLPNVPSFLEPILHQVARAAISTIVPLLIGLLPEFEGPGPDEDDPPLVSE